MLGWQHKFAGSIIGLVFCFCIWLHIENPLFVLIFCGLCLSLSIWGSVLPDFIDPVGSPFHRSIGHSFATLFLFTLAFVFSLGFGVLFRDTFLFVLFIIPASFFLSFVSHLLLDLMTPMGLPLFVGNSVRGLFVVPLAVIPLINILLLVLTLYLGYKSLKLLSKKMGGKTAAFLFFIPLWSIPLFFSMLLFNVDFSLL